MYPHGDYRHGVYLVYRLQSCAMFSVVSVRGVCFNQIHLPEVMFRTGCLPECTYHYVDPEDNLRPRYRLFLLCKNPRAEESEHSHVYQEV